MIGFSAQAFLSIVLAVWVFYLSRLGFLEVLEYDDADDDDEQTVAGADAPGSLDPSRSDSRTATDDAGKAPSGTPTRPALLLPGRNNATDCASVSAMGFPAASGASLSPTTTSEKKRELSIKRLELICDLVMVGNNIQLMSGIAIMITVFTDATNIDLYHLRLMFDVVSFVGLGSASALCVWAAAAAKIKGTLGVNLRGTAEHAHARAARTRALARLRRNKPPPSLQRSAADWLGFTGVRQGGGPAGAGAAAGRQGTWILQQRRLARAKTTLEKDQIAAEIQEAEREERVSRLSPRHRLTFTFAIMFLALAILLAVRMNSWTESPEPAVGGEGGTAAPLEHRAEETAEVTGRCYNTYLTSAPGSPQPLSDKIYIGITTSWLLISMLMAVTARDVAPKRRKRHNPHHSRKDLNPEGTRWLPGRGPQWRSARKVLVWTILQFPVHLYMMIALKTANQGLLEGGEGGEGHDENSWDFGQTIAVILLGVALNEAWEKFWEHKNFETELMQSGGMSEFGTGANTPAVNYDDDGGEDGTMQPVETEVKADPAEGVTREAVESK